jgi:hypothetical protein
MSALWRGAAHRGSNIARRHDVPDWRAPDRLSFRLRAGNALATPRRPTVEWLFAFPWQGPRASAKEGQSFPPFRKAGQMTDRPCVTSDPRQAAI